MGIIVPFVGGNGFNSPKVIEIAKEAAEGLIVATPWFGDKPDPKVKAFVQKFEKTYGKKPDQFAVQAYDALYIMAEALKKAGTADRDKLGTPSPASATLMGSWENFPLIPNGMWSWNRLFW